MTPIVTMVGDDDRGQPSVWLVVGGRIKRVPVERAAWPRYRAQLAEQADVRRLLAQQSERGKP